MAKTKWKPAGQGDLKRLAALLGQSEHGLEFKADKPMGPHKYKPSEDDPSTCATCGKSDKAGMHSGFGKAQPHASMKAELPTGKINDLPDSAFAYIEPGGKKDKDGKTTPRSLRHFPIHDAAHVRNALARAPQSPFGDKAMAKIKAAAKKFKIDVSDDTSKAEQATLEYKAGNEAALLDYWGGEGNIGESGGFGRCVDALSGHDDIDDPEALCAWIHHETTGKWPSEKSDDVADEVERKVLLPDELTGLGFKVLDEDEGIVETIVSVTGIVDRVNDNIAPGAYEKTLDKRRPKAVWSHDWDQPIGKTLDAKELPPGSPLLPATTATGDPWPADAGALLVKTQFNLNTSLGRDAFENVKFFGDEQQWSVGYKVPSGKSAVDRKSGVREIKEMDLYEYSPVLFGAMPLATTISAKASDPKGGLAEPAMVAATVASALLSHLDPAHGNHDLFARALGELTVIGNGGSSVDAATSCRFAASAASAIANASSGKMQRDALQAASAFRMIGDALEAADNVEDYMSGKADEEIEGKDIASPAARVANQGPTPTVERVPNIPAGVTGTQSTPAGRSMAQGQTPSTGSVPLGSNAAGSQAPAPDGGGLSSVRGSVSDVAPGGSDRDAWQVAHQYVDDGQGRCARCGHHLGADLHTGWTPSSANRRPGADSPAGEAGMTAQGTGTLQGSAATVPATTENHPIKRYDVDGYEVKIDVPMTGSWEEVQRGLRDQATTTLRSLKSAAGDEGDNDMDDYWVCLEATFPDHVIASFTDYKSGSGATYYTIPWMRDSDGSPMLGTPQEVDVAAVLTAKVDPEEIAGIIREVKAGRVLSAANKNKLMQAHGHLGDVLASAEVAGKNGDEKGDEEPTGDGDIDLGLMQLDRLRLIAGTPAE